MKCMFCENVKLIPVENCNLIYDDHEGLECPSCSERYIHNKISGRLMRISELNDNEYEEDYFDEGNPENYLDNFIEDFVKNNVKGMEDTFDFIFTDNINEVVEYVRDTIKENDLIREELDSISGTVSQLIEEYEELKEEKINEYVTIGDLIDKLSLYDRNMPLIIQKDSEGNDYSPLFDIDVDSVYVPTNTWSGEKYVKELTEEMIVDGYSEDDLPPITDNVVEAVFLVPVN